MLASADEAWLWNTLPPAQQLNTLEVHFFAVRVRHPLCKAARDSRRGRCAELRLLRSEHLLTASQLTLTSCLHLIFKRGLEIWGILYLCGWHDLCD